MPSIGYVAYPIWRSREMIGDAEPSRHQYLEAEAKAWMSRNEKSAG